MLFIILHLLLTTLIVPTAQDKARSYIRSSDLDFFEGVLKPKKFIDIVNDLTIYYESKDEFGQLKNIYLKSKTGEGDFQITLAKTGKFDQSFDRKVLVLYNGKTLKNQQGWMVTLEKLQITDQAKLMHCLPVRRNVVIADNAMDSKHSIIQDQAYNRVFAAQLVLKKLLTGS